MALESRRNVLVRDVFENVRLQGHRYVELRKAGKNLIFFCATCLAPCFNESCLHNHLNGYLHSKRLATLEGSLKDANPWPFRDDAFFFRIDLDTHRARTDKNKATVGPSESPAIPAVWQKGGNSDLVMRKIGVGKISARFHGKDGIFSKIRRIWCEWLGNVDISNEGIKELEFAVVTFSYNHELGLASSERDIRYLLPSIPHSEAEDHSSSRGKKRPRSSEVDSFREEPQSSSNSKSNEASSENDDRLIQSHIPLINVMRKHIRRVKGQRTCAICLQMFVQNKDVAALLNRRTGKLACTRTDTTGAFHIFHTSCLIQWILLSEAGIVESKGETISSTKVDGQSGEKHEMQENLIRTIYCPECFGSGIRDYHIGPVHCPLSEMPQVKIKLASAHKAWMRSPETLENCSVGLSFPYDCDVDQGNVAPLKFLHFYRASHCRL